MLDNFAAGGAAINQICATFDIGLKIFDLALDVPTGDITEEAAMDERAAAATFAFGMEATAGGSDLLCLGEMGIANTTSAAAIYHALYGGEAADWVGRGTGSTTRAAPQDFRRAEGRVVPFGASQGPARGDAPPRRAEIAAIAGAIVAARLQKVPVILDGYVATAAAAILHAADPAALDHCLAGHVSPEGAHGAVLERLKLKPVLDLGMRLGEGTGAAMAAAIVKGAVACHAGMATFAQAGVSGKGG